MLHDPSCFLKPPITTPTETVVQSKEETSIQAVSHTKISPSTPPLKSSNAGIYNGATQYFRRRTEVLLGTARMLVEGPTGHKVLARAFINNCSQPSFMSAWHRR